MLASTAVAPRQVLALLLRLRLLLLLLPPPPTVLVQTMKVLLVLLLLLLLLLLKMTMTMMMMITALVVQAWLQAVLPGHVVGQLAGIIHTPVAMAWPRRNHSSRA
jgi:hypothetical protein